MKQFLLNLFVSLVALQSYAQQSLEWEMYHPVQQTWLPFGQSGTVQEFLWHNGELPDPFYGENETKYQWIEAHTWMFRSKFFLNEAYYNAEELILDIPNLDTYAQIYLNGKLLAKTENFFVHYRFWLKRNDLICGYNQLEIRIEAPINYHAKTERYTSFTYPAPNDVGAVKVASLTRKPQYHFGWDWGPQLIGCGITEQVKLTASNQCKLSNVHVSTLAVNDSVAKMKLSFELIHADDANYTLSFLAKNTR